MGRKIEAIKVQEIAMLVNLMQKEMDEGKKLIEAILKHREGVFIKEDDLNMPELLNWTSKAQDFVRSLK